MALDSSANEPLRVVVAVGRVLENATPNHTPFSLNNPDISFPQKPDTVSTKALILAAVVAPAAIILLVVLFYIPGPAANRNDKSVIWRYKLREWNAGWLGLAVALAGAYMAAQGLKDLIGKPRPDLLDRCDPDLSNISSYVVGGLGNKLEGAPVLVTWEICKNKGHNLKSSGFSSFPSGHSSFSFAGLTYLTLWLCSKFQIAFSTGSKHSKYDSWMHRGTFLPFSKGHKVPSRCVRATPPLYLVIIALAPVAVASFIAGSRWYDHRHHGIDILFGSTMGIFFGCLGFRLYKIPARFGARWACDKGDENEASEESAPLILEDEREVDIERVQ